MEIAVKECWSIPRWPGARYIEEQQSSTHGWKLLALFDHCLGLHPPEDAVSSPRNP